MMDDDAPPTADEWREFLHGCNFTKAAELVNDFLRIAKHDAAEQGGTYFVTPQFRDAIVGFIQQPNTDTAVVLLLISPPLWRYFEGCLPGGLFTLRNDQ